ncbi:MAG: rhodanese-like domain-containing protein [Spirochaetota bacterium]
MKLENKQIAVYTAILLAIIMLFLPGPDPSKINLDLHAMAQIIGNKEDHVTPGELSQWIIAGNNDYQLIDIRSKDEYDKGHIEGSINIPLENLLNKNVIADELNHDKKIVLYSNGSSHASQAWVVLKGLGFDCYILEGGYNGWNAVVLNPATGSNATDDEVLLYAKQKAVAEYFGGSNIQMQKPINNVAPAAPQKPQGVKKKKMQGC